MNAVSGGDVEIQKRLSAEKAADEVRPGMVVGLGTGSTARYAIDRIGARHRAGELDRIVCVATSEASETQARALGLPLRPLASVAEVDLAMDGADEADPELDLVKGLGGALLREKQVARMARRFVVFVDESKRVERLGTRAPVPVEFRTQSEAAVARALAGLGARPVLRRKGDAVFLTDNGNPVFDAHFTGGVPDKHALAARLDGLDGVEAHGLFLGMCDELLVGHAGGVERVQRVKP